MNGFRETASWTNGQTGERTKGHESLGLQFSKSGESGVIMVFIGAKCGFLSPKKIQNF